MKINLRLFSTIILATFTFNSFAQNSSFKLSQKKVIHSLKGSEFVSGASYRDSMMKVKMLGEVNKPGLHVLPTNSSFTTLLAYAGGPTKDADTTKIRIKRRSKKGYKNIELNFKDFMKNNQKDIALKHNDLIYVEKESEFLSTRTLTVIATMLSIVVSGIVIKNEL